MVTTKEYFISLQYKKLIMDVDKVDRNTRKTINIK